MEIHATWLRVCERMTGSARLAVLAIVLVSPPSAQASTIYVFLVDEGPITLGPGTVLPVDEILGAFSAQFSMIGDTFSLTGTWFAGNLALQGADVPAALGSLYFITASFSGTGTVSDSDLLFSAVTLSIAGDPVGSPPVSLLTASSGSGSGSTAAGFITMQFFPFQLPYPYFLPPGGSVPTLTMTFGNFAPASSVDFTGSGNLTFQDVPEPSTLLLFGCGIAVHCVVRRQHPKKHGRFVKMGKDRA